MTMFYLKHIKLTNFRCYDAATYDFYPGINIILGDNATGKTSLVEAIHCLGFGRSFKSSKDSELIKKSSFYYNIRGEFISENEINDILLAYDAENKQIKHNEKVYKSISEYLGYFNTVVFSPDDLELIKGSPAIRRKFLDINLAQINKQYLYTLIRFKALLKERNQYLKTQTDPTLLNVLTESFIDTSKRVISQREAFVASLNQVVGPISLKLSKGREKVELVYKPNVNVDNLWKSAKEHASYDTLMQTTTWGPSRDEVLILINGELAATYSSQGQIRTACLAIKLALTEQFSEFNDKIIVILDDVFSELDSERQNELLMLLNKTKQIFITTTSVDNLSPEVLNNSKIIEIRRRREE